MKLLHWFSAGMALALSLCLATPVLAASGQAKSASNQASSVKKESAKKLSQKKQTPKKSSKSGKSKSKASKKKQVSEREIWLQRVQSADILSGKASWYGRDFHNKDTASGLSYDMFTFTAAHRSLPLGTVVKVTDQENGKSVMVCVTDRGPYVRGRIIDLSYAAAKQLDLNRRGVGRVNLEVISDERGQPLDEGQAFFVRYKSGPNRGKVGPFQSFADVSAMQEALRQAHPEAEVVLDSK